MFCLLSNWLPQFWRNWWNNFRIFYIPPTLRSNKDIRDNHPKCHTGRCHQAAAPKKCPSADKPAAHTPRSPCCRPVMFAVIHRCMRSSVPLTKLISKSCRSSTQILRIPWPCWGRSVPAKARSSDKERAAAPLRLERATRQNTITPSLRSFARPLAVHEFAISSALVWWQLTSCKSQRGQWPPLWEQLLTWPLIRRPHMYQTRAERRPAELRVSLTDMLKPCVKHSGRSHHSEYRHEIHVEMQNSNTCKIQIPADTRGQSAPDKRQKTELCVLHLH